MSQIAKSKVAVLLSGIFAASIPVLAFAATQPDAGSILDTVRSKDFAPPNKSEPGIDVQQESQSAGSTANGIKTKVTAFHITGSTVYTEAQLQDLIASSVGQELSLADLEKVAAQISRFYRGQGYFVARAYLPAQKIKDGVVEIAVLEGRIGSVNVKLEGKGGISENAIKNTVSGSAKPGDVINESHLERGLLLANDLAGVSIDSTLVPGASVGTSDLIVQANQTGTFAGSVNYDNFGNKFTGANRVGASVSFNNPASQGDQIGLQVLTSGSGLNYGRLSYLLPVGSMGTKVGVAYSGMEYKLGGAFASTLGEGSANIGSIFAIHPIIRSRNYNLYGQIGFDSKHLIDKVGGDTSDDKKDNVLTASISGDSRDGIGSGGVNSYNFTYASGKLDLSDVPSNLVADSTSAQTNGSWGKTNYSLSRLQRLSDNLSVYASLSGQAALNNLDSSEKFVLGGAGGVRAYPQGEASGDSGQLVNIEVRHDLGTTGIGTFQLLGFYDIGQIQLNKNPWNGWQGTNTGLTNSYTISGAGLGINLNKPSGGNGFGGYSVKAYLAAKIGSNPGADAQGNDSDGSNSSARFWLQASKLF